jgi:hypothetical protein
MSRAVVHHFKDAETGECGHVVELGHKRAAVYQHPAPAETDRAFARRITAEAFGPEAAESVDPDFCRIEGDE